ncbi:MAG: 30S ribosome-binding factor RbfA [Pseudomonadota bacterium]
MPREFSRGRRIGDLIQQEIARLIQQEIQDPRIGLVTVTEVKVSRDLAYADIYFTMIGADNPGVAEATLDHAAGFLRSQLAKMLSTRTTPRLRFHYDTSIETGDRLARAIDAALESDRQHPDYGKPDEAEPSQPGSEK